MNTKHKPATPLEFIIKFPRYVYHSHKGKKTVQWREAAMDLAKDRARLVEALRSLLVSIPQEGVLGGDARALLRELGEAK